MALFFSIKDHAARASRSRLALQANEAPFSASSKQHDWVSSTSTRTEVCPPALFAQSQPLWQRWASTAWQWLWDDEDLENHPRVLQGLQQVKQAFVHVLWDLQSYQASHVRNNIETCRSLRDLWHLRTDVFQLIAVHRGEVQAQQRLDSLNRHFPVRVSVSTQRLN
jgi:hypothetical protein